ASASVLVPTRQSSASGLSLLPWHAPHAVYARYFDSSTRMCILYALVSSQAKKRRTPYQVPGQDLRQLTHSGSPSSTHCFWRTPSSRHGTSRGMPRLTAYFSRSSWHSRKLCVCQGLMAPSLSVFASSGTMRPKSMPITRPKPRQVSHAPSGELNENRLGIGSRYERSQSGQWSALEYFQQSRL